MIISVVVPRNFNPPWEFVKSLAKVMATGEYMFCEDCKEHCVGEPEITFEEWVEEQRVIN